MIVSSQDPITLVGGGQVDASDVNLALAHAPTLVAADGGADRALAFGHAPVATIGDFDSITDKARAALSEDRLHHIAEQDSTDFEKALREISAPLVIGVGFTGARVDHQLAVINTLVRFPQKRCILLGAHEILVLCPPTLRLDVAAGTTVSLFPMGAVEGVSDGLKWPIGGLHFAPDGQVGTSNEATGPIDIAVTAPKMLLMLPRAVFPQMVAALLATSSRWEGGSSAR
ncbi:MAG: thiamine diphosphokinase [Pseudomonadota bacterium]